MGMTDDRGSSLGHYILSEETIRMAQRIAQQTTHSTSEVLEEISARLARGDDYPWLADIADPMYGIRKGIIERISKEAANDCLYFNLHSREQVVMTYRSVAPEDDPDVVYVQISNRKYNYTSDNAPYHCSKKNTIWYRNHYYSSSYTKDSSSYNDTPSAYNMYNGTTIHNIGNGYFDSYSSSIKQSSVNSRKSSSGGVSSGK